MRQTVKIRRPKAIVFDILGTASKSGFLEKILFPFLKTNLEAYINTHWSKNEFIHLYQKIKEQSIEFNKQEPSTPIVMAHDSSEAKASLLNFINFVTENGINSPAVTNLRFKVWFEGYQQQKIRTPIYTDVSNKLQAWFKEGVKINVFSNTWVEAQKALLRNTNHGDLTSLISGHYDNDFGLLTEADSWRRFCASIKQMPNDVLFLTKSALEGRAACEAGLNVVLVLTHRHNVKAVSKEDRKLFPYVRTLDDLEWLEASAAHVGGSQQAPPSGAGSGAVGIGPSEMKSSQLPKTASTSAVTAGGAIVSGAGPSAMTGSASQAGAANSRSSAASAPSSRTSAQAASSSASQASASSAQQSQQQVSRASAATSNRADSAASGTSTSTGARQA